MSMIEWAEREVAIACKRERGDKAEDEWDYGCACYESALKAYKSLAEDGHSGFSFSMTRFILERLMAGNPLTPIEDTDDIWNKIIVYKDNVSASYQCKRMRSLFKDVYSDGSVEYHDVERFVGVNINDPDCEYHSSLVSSIGRDLFPITMPYIPENKPYKVYCEDFLTDRKNGDFDTVGILYIICPNGERRIFIDTLMVLEKAGERSMRANIYLERLERLR